MFFMMGITDGRKDFDFHQQGYGYTMRHCRNCGFSTAEDFEYCPKCGTRLSE